MVPGTGTAIVTGGVYGSPTTGGSPGELTFCLEFTSVEIPQ